MGHIPTFVKEVDMFDVLFVQFLTSLLHLLGSSEVVLALGRSVKLHLSI